MNNDKCVEILSNFIDTQTPESDLLSLLDSVASYFSRGVMIRKPREHNRHWRKDYIGGIGGLFLYAFYKRQVLVKDKQALDSILKLLGRIFTKDFNFMCIREHKYRHGYVLMLGTLSIAKDTNNTKETTGISLSSPLERYYIEPIESYCLSAGLTHEVDNILLSDIVSGLKERSDPPTLSVVSSLRSEASGFMKYHSLENPCSLHFVRRFGLVPFLMSAEDPSSVTYFSKAEGNARIIAYFINLAGTLTGKRIGRAQADLEEIRVNYAGIRFIGNLEIVECYSDDTIRSFKLLNPFFEFNPEKKDTSSRQKVKVPEIFIALEDLR